MKTNLKLAWRNIWRNKRRTLITAASIFFAIFFALIMRAFQVGSYDHMIDNVLGTYSGYIQVHQKGYWDDKVINNTFEASDSLLTELQDIDNISLVLPRLETFALGSSEDKTKGVMMLGINPEKEDSMTNISDKIIEGQFLTSGHEAVVLAERLAGFLNLTVGDTLILIGQGYHGVSAAGKYPIQGIFSHPNPEFNNTLVYLNLPAAQRMYGAENRLTAWVFDLEDGHRLQETLQAVKQKVPDTHYEVKSWRQMLVELVQQIESDRASGFIMLGLLYIIIGFGVLGTVLMMTAERRREMGVMVAVGMRKAKLVTIITLELVIIGLLGIVTGAIASLPVIIYYVKNPIQLTGEMAEAMLNFGMEPVMPFALQADYFIGQSLAVVVIVIIASIYPLITISRLNVIKALRG